MMDRDSVGPVEIGRYVLYDRIASGGMAAVYLGRLAGPVGFARTVAIKRLHPQFAADTDFVTMFLDEARLAARIQHPNVVPTLDIIATNGELFLVMEYIRGEPLGQLVKRTASRMENIPERVVAGLVSGALQGLHAAHEANDESGARLEIVHRDVSPQNIIVGVDGTPRVLDFGVAKAEGKFHSTRGGEIKGKILYMSPEQLEADAVDRTTDVYAMGLVLFELLTGKRMFAKSQDMTSLGSILRNELTMPSSIDPELAKWDAIVAKASGRREGRYATARAMAIEVEKVCGGVASAVEIAEWVEQNAGPQLQERAQRVAEIESGRARVGRQDIEAALKSELLGDGSAKSERTAGSQVSHAIDLPSSRRLASGESVDPAAVDFRPKSKARKIAPLALVAVAVIGAAIFVVKRGDHVDATPAPPPPATTTAAPQPTENAVAIPIVKPPNTTIDEPPPPPQTSATEKVKAAKTNAKLPPPVAKPNCDTPYTIDAQGHKHFRTECL
jgi:serine/threonine-protein kinase